MERRLAAILFGDVVGYSRLMEADEEGTLEAVQVHRTELIAPVVDARNGRIVKFMGDGNLIEFPSVVDAVGAAVEIQAGLRERNADVEPDKRINLRVGVHLGDVIVEGEDIYGDGVNVAARLESLAEAGGICISQQALDQVETKLDLDFVDLGEQRIKNIERPIHVYKVGSGDPATAPRQSPKPRNRRRFIWTAIAGAASCLTIVTMVALWWRPWETAVAPAKIERMAHVLPDRPSLAVLPFMNMSDDYKQQHFADGMSDDLITDLSRISGLFVIARNSTFVYRNQSVSIPSVAEALGVRFVLEGSVRRDGDKLRVNAQLIDAMTGGHVWAQRYDGVATEVFTVQDMFVREIVNALKVNLTGDEEKEIALGQTRNLSAREVFQKGWEKFLRYTPEDNASAAALLKQAVEIDPEYGRAYAALGLTYLRGCQMRWNEPLGMSAGMANAEALNYLDETRDRPSSLANVAASGINLYNSRHDEAMTEATRAISTDPNDPEAYIAMAWTMITTGKPEAGLELVRTAMRLNPSYPSYYVFPRATAHYAMGNIEKTLDILAEALAEDPGATELTPLLAASYAQLGEREKARATLLLWRPGASQEELDRAIPTYHFPYKWSKGRDVLNRLSDGLQLAALPPGRTVATLIDDLSSENRSDRSAAARTLGLFGPMAVDAVTALVGALADENQFVRRTATISLGKIGPSAIGAVQALSAMQDERAVGMHAKDAIAKITGR